MLFLWLDTAAAAAAVASTNIHTHKDLNCFVISMHRISTAEWHNAVLFSLIIFNARLHIVKSFKQNIFALSLNTAGAYMKERERAQVSESRLKWYD